MGKLIRSLLYLQLSFPEKEENLFVLDHALNFYCFVCYLLLLLRVKVWGAKQISLATEKQ